MSFDINLVFGIWTNNIRLWKITVVTDTSSR